MYKAIVNFTDLQDGSRGYSVGDVYPRNGYIPFEGRVEELAGASNKLGKPVIEYIEDEPETVQTEPTEELPKRRKRRLKDDE
ncbi:MAG: hypothetical protein IJ740_03570 [Ruminococcus sp.]|nr:hypothetical protein [Ruminococcus sp.]